MAAGQRPKVRPTAIEVEKAMMTQVGWMTAGNGEKVLIIDDFLASGATIQGLARLAQTAGAVIVGIGALVEKTFEGGRKALANLGVPIEALARIRLMEGDQIIFEDD